MRIAAKRNFRLLRTLGLTLGLGLFFAPAFEMGGATSIAWAQEAAKQPKAEPSTGKDGASTQTRLMDRIVAVVGPRIILQSELAIELQISPLIASRLMELGGRPTPEAVAKVQSELTPAVLDALIGDQLILLEGEKYPTLTLSEAELQSYLVNIAQGNNLGSVDKLREEVERSGQYGGWAQYRKTMRRQVGVYKVQVSLVPSAEVSDAEVLAHYRELGRGEDAKVTVHRWVFGGADGENNAKQAAATLGKSVLNHQADSKSSSTGTQQEDAETSEDAATPSGQDIEALIATLPGGRPLVIARGNAAPAVDEALFQNAEAETSSDPPSGESQEGKIVGPIKVGQQWLLFAIKKRQASKLAPFAQVKEQLKAKLQQERREKSIKDFRERLRAKTHVDIRL